MSQMYFDVMHVRRVEALRFTFIVRFAVNQFARCQLCCVIGAGKRSAFSIKQQELLVIRLSN